MENILKEFFAVTISGSVYRVWCEGVDFVGRVEKIFSANDIGLEIGARLNIDGRDYATHDNYIGIGSNICLYNGHHKDEQRPTADLVNPNFWGGETSSIVSLFLERGEAIKCAKVGSLQRYDMRWAEETVAVVKAIGTDHPRFALGLNYEERRR